MILIDFSNFIFSFLDEVIPVEAGSTQPDDYDDEEWCDEDEEDDEDVDFDFDATTPFVNNL